MATTDDKVLTGAGVAQLSQLVKSAIAEGGGGTEYTAGPGIEISSENEITNSITGGLIPYILTDSGGNWSYANSSIGSYRNITPEMTNDEVYQLWRTTDVLINQGSARTLSKQDYPELPDIYYLITAYDSATDTLTKTTKSTGMNGFQIPSYAWVIHDTVFSSYTSAKQFYKALYGKAISVKNFTNFNGGSLPTTFGNIDQALTDAKALATTETAGTVIPDGTSITIDSNGVISSQGGSGSSYTFTNGLTESGGTVSWDLNNAIQPGSTYNNNIHIGKIYSGANGITGAGAIGIGWHAYATGQEAIAHATDGNTVSGLGAIGLGNCNVYARDALGFGPNSSIGRAGMSQTGNTGTVLLGHSNIVDSTYAAKDFGLGAGLTVSSDIQLVLGFKNVEDANSQFSVIIGNGDAMHSIKRNGMAFAKDNSAIYASGNLYVGCTDYTTTSSGPTTTNCGGQKVFYGTLTSTETAPTVEGAINWVYE